MLRFVFAVAFPFAAAATPTPIPTRTPTPGPSSPADDAPAQETLGTPALASPTPALRIKLEVTKDRDGPVVTEFKSDVPNIFVRWTGENLPVDSDARVAWIAEDVGDVAPPNFIVDQMVTTIARPEFGARFTLSRPRDGWAPGRYRVELYLEEELVGTVKVTIED